jgi:hypothetical protein
MHIAGSGNKKISVYDTKARALRSSAEVSSIPCRIFSFSLDSWFSLYPFIFVSTTEPDAIMNTQVCPDACLHNCSPGPRSSSVTSIAGSYLPAQK